MLPEKKQQWLTDYAQNYKLIMHYGEGGLQFPNDNFGYA